MKRMFVGFPSAEKRDQFLKDHPVEVLHHFQLLRMFFANLSEDDVAAIEAAGGSCMAEQTIELIRPVKTNE